MVPKGPSIRAWIAAGVSRIVIKRPVASPARLISRYRAWFGAPLPVSALYRVYGGIVTTMEPVPGEWVGDRSAGRVLLYVHGGGFVACSPSTHRPVTVTLTRLLRVASFVPRYPLAPEYPFPAALDAVFVAYRSLLSAYRPENIVLAGDSAGGGLLCSVLMRARDEGLSLPARAVCFSPWVNLARPGDYAENSESCATFYPEHLSLIASAYLQGGSPLHPLASPVLGDLSRFPPMLIQVSNSELLFADARRLHDRLQRAKVESTLSIYSGVPHGWQMMTPWLPEARRALNEAAEFLR